jgi:hypothetical protein
MNPAFRAKFSPTSKLKATSTDCVAERGGFELLVPVSKLADDSFQATFATERRLPEKIFKRDLLDCGDA